MAGPISKKALRDASPADVLPYEVCRKYGEPKLFGSLGQAREAVLNDLNDLEDLVGRIGTDEDRARLKALRADLTTRLAGDFDRVEADELVDSYTGVRYNVTVTDRRRA